ncbi:MAG: MBL fold metallo-hydrolase, partial [Candidatus Dadabacteria bacterium]|nr:MBL fold metallo-hydrolase [Candidatus Dadabacteria bacterium]
VCYVINTHIHFDHVLGNKAFEHGETKFVGHKNLQEAIEANRGFFLQEFAGDLGPDPSENSI